MVKKVSPPTKREVQRLRTWVSVSRLAIRQNYLSFRRLIGPAVGIMPIIKADAYGHGWAPALAALHPLTPWGYGVATGEEAFRLRRMLPQQRIVVLSAWQPEELPDLMKQRIELSVWDFVTLERVASYCRKKSVHARIHIKLDTGTTRIGFLAAEVPRLTATIKRMPGVNVVGVFSHFANAESKVPAPTTQQKNRFTTLNTSIPLVQGGVRHLACTAAVIRYPEARFDLIRPGIGLYGLWPSSEIRHWTQANITGFTLRPALTWSTRILQIKTVPANTGIGYGSTYITTRKTVIGILPVGYADGYPRAASPRARVQYRQQLCPVIGRICMNLMMIDLSHVSKPRVGDVVNLIGPRWTADDLAMAAGTINYEITTRINPGIIRIAER